MVVPEFSGGYLAGTSSESAAVVGDDDGEVDDGRRTTAERRSYSMVVGVAPRLAFVFPNSDEMRTETKMTVRASTMMDKHGISFRIPRAGQGRRKK